jgi:hypothetical protein
MIPCAVATTHELPIDVLDPGIRIPKRAWRRIVGQCAAKGGIKQMQGSLPRSSRVASTIHDGWDSTIASSLDHSIRLANVEKPPVHRFPEYQHTRG